MSDPQTLLALLHEARLLVLRPGNDFIWSGWEDADDAVREIDGLIAAITAGSIDEHGISVIFAPTGAMQELSMSSGWSDEYLALAARVDRALGER